jgi:hypothetical protein
VVVAPAVMRVGRQDVPVPDDGLKESYKGPEQDRHACIPLKIWSRLVPTPSCVSEGLYSRDSELLRARLD